MFANLLFVNSTPDLNISFTSSNKVIFDWSSMIYRNLTFSNINIKHAMKSNNIKCKLSEHRHQINIMYSQICCALKQSANDSIHSSKIHDCRDYIVPGLTSLRSRLRVLLVMLLNNVAPEMQVGHGLILFVVI